MFYTKFALVNKNDYWKETLSGNINFKSVFEILFLGKRIRITECI
jgi:hypothetical protein